jgi:hypothetical protein
VRITVICGALILAIKRLIETRKSISSLMMAFSVSLMPFVCISSPSCNVLTLTPIHEYIHVYQYLGLFTYIRQVYIYMYICIYIYLYIHINICLDHIHTHTSIYIYIHIHIYMYTYTIMSIITFRLIFGATRPCNLIRHGYVHHLATRPTSRDVHRIPALVMNVYG